MIYKLFFRHRRIKVMADFTSDGIWDMKTGIMISHDELKLPKELCDELYEWMKYYDTCFTSDYTTFGFIRLKKLNKWGREIAVKLRAFLPSIITVAYQGEDETGIWKPEIIKVKRDINALQN